MVMPQYSICGLHDAPEILVVILQSDLIDKTGTIVVAPLVPAAVVKPVRRLNPAIEHRGLSYLLITNKIAAVPAQEITRPVGSAQDCRDAISNALDFLFRGF